MIEAALFLGAYLIGAIPFGYLIARAHGVNIFEVGSGNVGATNIKRALGWRWALVVFGLDVLKGVGPTYVGMYLKDSQVWGVAFGLAAILGHCLSPFLMFRGGKGIATALGVVLAGSPAVALSAFGLFLAVLAISGWVSVASLIAVPSSMLFAWIYGDEPGMFAFYGALILFVLSRHGGNIRRLKAGTEPKFRWKDSSASKPNSEEVEGSGQEDRPDMKFASNGPVAGMGRRRA